MTTLIKIFFTIHGDELSEEEFIEWKTIRLKQKSYVHSLKDKPFITNEEVEELSNMIDTASLDEMKTYNLKDLRTKVSNMKVMRRRIKYPKPGLEDYKRMTKTGTARPTRKSKEPELVIKDRTKFRNAVYKAYKKGEIDITEKERLYVFKKEATIDKVRAHSMFPLDRKRENTFKKKYKTIEIKDDTADLSPELPTCGSSVSDGGESPVHRSSPPTKSIKPSTRKCDLPLRRPPKAIWNKRLSVHSESISRHNESEAGQSDEGDSPETSEHQSPEQHLCNSPREWDDGDDNTDTGILQHSVDSERAESKDRRSLGTVRHFRLKRRDVQYEPESPVDN
jgi:hypothetical protein